MVNHSKFPLWPRGPLSTFDLSEIDSALADRINAIYGNRISLPHTEAETRKRYGHLLLPRGKKAVKTSHKSEEERA